MKLPRKIYETRNQKVLDFAIGFVGWFIINGMLYVALILAIQLVPGANQDSLVAVALGGLPLLFNVGALIFFAFVRRWIALGALAAFAITLVGVLLLGLLVYAICFNTNN